MTKHLFLVGFRGSGKSTVARELAQRLSRPWLDLDAQIENDAQSSIDGIFRDGGEQGFRDWESAALRRVAQQPSTIVALGGGAVLRDSNRQLLKETGRVVWLDAEPEVLHRRIEADPTTARRRPALTDQSDGLREVQQLCQEREPLYREVADLRLESGAQRPNQLATTIADWWLDQE